ncbi:DUF1223 domain-containing protein [Ancylobacter terrae]|uniref:DUF1223 domain-containing protein n=1 Tax=Ancylobacter sp. sgz301288 TaxID=3342077 RepID=UPI003858CDE8
MAGSIGRIVGARACALTGFGMMATLVLAGGAQAQSPDTTSTTAPKAVVELFTSQGCSSCPPADKLISDMTAKRPDVIALTLAVDYWDYLGWKDTLAKHGHSMRQKAYARLRGDGRMFTPQVVVNGVAMAVGSDGPAVETAVQSAVPPSVPVALAVTEGKLAVGVGAGSASGEVWLCPLASSVTVAIGRGENEGKQVTYHNVVRRWVKLGDWNGAAAQFETPVAAFMADGIDAVAVLVQRGTPGTPGAIVGAGVMALPKEETAKFPPAPASPTP